MRSFSAQIAIAAICFSLLSGCGSEVDDGIRFLEEAPSQAASISDFSSLQFTDASGQTAKITDLFETDYLVLVITRGFNGSICLYCSSQTSKWARRYSELASTNADLAVVFPTIDTEETVHVDDLKTKILDGPITNDSVPFPILLDFDLASIKQLGLQAELAKPSTYIIDRQGKVLYAYVGQSMADRPSVDSVLNQLKRLPKK